MTTVKFKTNIKCTGCIATVSPALNKVAGADNWNVDLKSPDKVLTISAPAITATAVTEALQAVGYKAEKLG